MKFYFCEACGKRLTEHDIDDGVARNKKLKGVYCKECAIGVTTMESLPMTAQEANKVLEKEEPRRESGATPARPARKTTANRLPAARKRPSRRESSNQLPSAHAAQTSYLKVIIPAAVAGLLAIGLAMVFILRKSPPGEVVVTRKNADKPKTDGAKQAETTRLYSTGKTPKPVAPQKKVEPPSTPPSAKKEPPDRKPVPKVTSLPDSGRKNAKPTPPQNAVPKAKPKPKKAPKPPDPVAIATGKLKPTLEVFEDAVLAGDFVAASKCAEAAAAKAELKPVAGELAALVQVGEAFAQAKAKKKKALAALIDGKERTLQTLKGPVKGEIRKIEGDVLRIWGKGRINNQVVEFEKEKIKLSDLTPAYRAKLLKESRPGSPDEWLAETVRAFIAKDLTAAEKTLANAEGHPLAKIYKFRINAIRAAKREAEANQYWKEHVSALLNEVKLTKDQARAGLKVVEAFRENHGKTEFAESVAERTNMLEKAMRDTVFPPKERTLDLGGGVKMVLLLVPAGTFVRGDPKGEPEPDSVHSRPQHKVTLTRDYYLGKYEVTEAQYKQVMGTCPTARGPNHPAAFLNWFHCRDFCKKASEKTGKRVRLPSEAEWEYACRAGSTTRYCFGDDDAGLNEYGWSNANGMGQTHPVGEKSPNKFGFYDMHGNVFEWVQDFSAPYPRKAVTNPKGPKNSPWRIQRGGCFKYKPAQCRSARRVGYVPEKGFSSSGFRVVVEF